MGRTFNEDRFNKVIKKTKQAMPFKCKVCRPIRLVDVRERQLTSVLCGLNFLKAPVVPCR